MKHFLLAPFALALLTAPRLALAQTTNTTAAKPAITITTRTAAGVTTTTKVPTADELFDQIFDPYETARTFRGTFDLVIPGEQPNAPPQKIHLKVLFRSNPNGAVRSDATILKIVGQIEGQDITFQILDNGRQAQLIVGGQEAKLETQLADAVKTVERLEQTLDKVGGALDKLDDSDATHLLLSVSVEEDRPVLVLSAKDSTNFRAVVDAQTRALRSLELGAGLSIRAQEQTFDAPLLDSEFGRTPLTGLGSIEVTLVLSSLLGDSEVGTDPANTSQPVTAKPTPSK